MQKQSFEFETFHAPQQDSRAKENVIYGLIQNTVILKAHLFEHVESSIGRIFAELPKPPKKFMTGQRLLVDFGTSQDWSVDKVYFL